MIMALIGVQLLLPVPMPAPGSAVWWWTRIPFLLVVLAAVGALSLWLVRYEKAPPIGRQPSRGVTAFAVVLFLVPILGITAYGLDLPLAAAALVASVAALLLVGAYRGPARSRAETLGGRGRSGLGQPRHRGDERRVYASAVQPSTSAVAPAPRPGRPAARRVGAERRDDAEVVRHHDHRHPLRREPAEQFDDLDAGGHIQRADRFVGQQHTGRDTIARAMAMRWRWPPENSCG